MDNGTVAKALQDYRDAERAYVDATFPFFSGNAGISVEHKAHVKELRAALERARGAYLEALANTGWSVPFREWSERPTQAG